MWLVILRMRRDASGFRRIRIDTPRALLMGYLGLDMHKRLVLRTIEDKRLLIYAN